MLVLVGSLLSTATAAEIMFAVSTPVQIQVNGTFVDAMGGTATVRDLPAGTHTVRVIDMMSKPILTQEIVVAEDDHVVMRYKARALTETSRGKLTDGEGGPPPGAGGAMPVSQFDVLVEHVRKAASTQSKHELVHFAGALFSFSVDQVQLLMGAFPTDADKVSVVKVLRPKITDPSRSSVLASAVGSAHRAEVEALF